MKTKESVSYPTAGVTSKFLFASRRDVDCIDVSPASPRPAGPGLLSAGPGLPSAGPRSGFAAGRKPGNLGMMVEAVVVMPEHQRQPARSKFGKLR